ncbi:MAG TPA: sugar MFS transporter [Terracidiphilus sp.]|jgi:FHS family L-fucose permease-like MFS transporter|nr:sugar MFS transporter [Terracidiphilus sp.]
MSGSDLGHARPAPLVPKGRIAPFLVVTPLFFLWAIPNNLTDILIRQFMKSFEVNGSGAAQLQLGIFVGYFLLAIPAGQIMRHYGYKIGLVTGLILMASGCWMFWPAALAGRYAYFVAAQFVIGSGLSFLETGANSFIAQLGPAESSERRLNFSQAFNPLGSITAGLVGTVFIFSGVELSGAEAAARRASGTMQAYLHAETLRVVPVYVVLGSVALLWALIVLAIKFPDLAAEDASREDAGPARHVRLMQRHFVMAVLAQFLYVGAQVGTWSYFILYVRSATGVGDKFAGYMLTGTLAAFAVGRFSSAWLMRHFHARRMLALYAMVNVVLGLVAVTRPKWLDELILRPLHEVNISLLNHAVRGLMNHVQGELANQVANRLLNHQVSGMTLSTRMWLSYVDFLRTMDVLTSPGWLGVHCLLLTSLFMSIMFPTIFAMGLKGMGEKTKTAGSLLVMAILGGAALTKVMGVLRDASGLQAAYLVPVVCFAGVGLYAWLWAERRVVEE